MALNTIQLRAFFRNCAIVAGQRRVAWPLAFCPISSAFSHIFCQQNPFFHLAPCRYFVLKYPCAWSLQIFSRAIYVVAEGFWAKETSSRIPFPRNIIIQIALAFLRVADVRPYFNESSLSVRNRDPGMVALTHEIQLCLPYSPQAAFSFSGLRLFSMCPPRSPCSSPVAHVLFLTFPFPFLAPR